MSARTLVLTALAALVLALAALASGCGSSSSNSGVAALDDQSSASDDSTDSSGSGSSTSTSDDPQEAALKWARCMRKNGVDVPDPQVNGGRVRIGPGVGSSGVAPDSEKFREAMKTCGTPFGNARPPQLSEADRAALQESLLAFAKCMREHGVDMPDPQFGQGGGGGGFRIGGPGSGIDPESPRFQAAQKACEPIMQEARDTIGAPSVTRGAQ